MKDLDSRAKIERLDGSGSFVEIMADGVPIDKVALNFVTYDKNAAVGNRMNQSVKFYLPVTEAWALSQKISNGRLARQAKKSIDSAAAANSKFPKAVYTRLGGTNARDAKRKDGKALSRSFSIAPGSKYPWVLTAESGPGVPGPNGLLIVPDYGHGKPVEKPEMLVRIPLSDDDLLKFAAALDTSKQVWDSGRFLPLVETQIANLKTPNKSTVVYPINDINSTVDTSAKHSDVEVSIDKIAIDKARIILKPEDAKIDDKGIELYLAITTAWALSQKIISGQFVQAAKPLLDEAIANGDDCSKPVFLHIGGTIATKAGRADKKPTYREFSISMDKKYNWVFSAETGPGVSNQDGFLPDYGPDKETPGPDRKITTILNNDALEEFAAALDTCKRVWDIGRFLPLVQDTIDEKNKKWLDDIESRKMDVQRAEAAAIASNAGNVSSCAFVADYGD